jgi:endonuclease/exonuclease/phosphatase family metal-dependent hydrolase
LGAQFEYLADSLWPHFAYGKNAVYSDGHHGNAILSKMPMIRYENINVSTNKLERRGLLHAEVEIASGKMLHLLCLHLDLTARGRRRQIFSLIERVKNSVPQTDRLIVAGDFNDWNEKITDPLAQELGLVDCGQEIFGEHVRTYPTWRPFLSLDRIYVRGLSILQMDVLNGPGWRRMSDHAALAAELQI